MTASGEFDKAEPAFQNILDTAEQQARVTAASIEQAWRATVRDQTEQTIAAQSNLLDQRIRGEAATVNAMVSKARANIDKALDDMFDSINEKVRQLRTTYTEDVLDAAAEVTGKKGQLEGLLSQFKNAVESYHAQATAAQVNVPGELEDMEKSINEKLAKVDEINTKIEETIPKFATRTVRMWSGGCGHHAWGCGWQRYCLNRQDFDTMDGYASRDGDRMAIRVAGTFRSFFYAMSHARYSYVQTRTSQGTKVSGGDHRDGSGWWNHGSDWGDLRSDVVLPMSSGNYFDYWTHRGTHGWGCSGSYNWHSWNQWGSHSRVQVTYMGEM